MVGEILPICDKMDDCRSYVRQKPVGIANNNYKRLFLREFLEVFHCGLKRPNSDSRCLSHAVQQRGQAASTIRNINKSRFIN